MILSPSDQIDVYTAHEVASYKLPGRMEISDALPRNPVGKVLRRVLREKIAGP